MSSLSGLCVCFFVFLSVFFLMIRLPPSSTPLYSSAASDVYKRQMPYVNVPNDLSKIKTKMAFNLTKRQLVCFGSAGAVGIPAYLLTRGTLGNTGAMFLMLGIMLPAFLLAMYEKDGLPFEKVVRNIIRAKFLRPGIRAYRTENIYAPFAGPGAGKEDVIEKHKEEKRSRRQG